MNPDQTPTVAEIDATMDLKMKHMTAKECEQLRKAAALLEEKGFNADCGRLLAIAATQEEYRGEQKD